MIIPFIIFFSGVFAMAAPINNCSDIFLGKTDNYFVTKAISAADALAISVPEWKLSQEDESQIRDIFTDSTTSDERKMQELYFSLVNARLKNVNPLTRFLSQEMIARSLATLFSPEDASVWPDFDREWTLRNIGASFTSEINEFFVFDALELRLQVFISAMHETEHGIDFNKNPVTWKISNYLRHKVATETMIPELHTRRKEARAIGAEWEFLSRIPVSVLRE